jgi:ubiquitin-protein ligase
MASLIHPFNIEPESPSSVENMAGPSRTQGPIKRLLTELKTYQSDPNEALLELGPVNDDELTSWRAVMKGVPGTAYEGRFLPCIIECLSSLGFPPYT